MGGIFEMPAIPEMGYPIPGCAGAFPDDINASAKSCIASQYSDIAKTSKKAT